MKSNSINYVEDVDDAFDLEVYRKFLNVNAFVIDDFDASEVEEKNVMNEKEEDNYID